MKQNTHSYSMNTATTVKECPRRASTDWQCNREHALDEHLVHKKHSDTKEYGDRYNDP